MESQSVIQSAFLGGKKSRDKQGLPYGPMTAFMHQPGDVCPGRDARIRRRDVVGCFAVGPSAPMAQRITNRIEAEDRPGQRFARPVWLSASAAWEGKVGDACLERSRRGLRERE